MAMASAWGNGRPQACDEFMELQKKFVAYRKVVA